MAQDYAASVQGLVVRVTRLNVDGTLATGANASYIMKSFINLAFTPEYEEGDEVTQKAADGSVCVTYKTPDTLKRATLTLSICNPDPEFTQMLQGGAILTDSGMTQGYAAPLIGVDGNPGGVALEVWSQAINAQGQPSTVRPYWHFIFPYARLRASGDRTFENGAFLANAFEGYALGNVNFATGPDNSWAYISDRAYAYARTASAPINLSNGYQAVTP